MCVFDLISIVEGVRCRVVVEMSPKDVDAFFNLGAMYAELGRKEEAVRSRGLRGQTELAD